MQGVPSSKRRHHIVRPSPLSAKQLPLSQHYILLVKLKNLLHADPPSRLLTQAFPCRFVLICQKTTWQGQTLCRRHPCTHVCALCCWQPRCKPDPILQRCVGLQKQLTDDSCSSASHQETVSTYFPIAPPSTSAPFSNQGAVDCSSSSSGSNAPTNCPNGTHAALITWQHQKLCSTASSAIIHPPIVLLVCCHHRLVAPGAVGCSTGGSS